VPLLSICSSSIPFSRSIPDSAIRFQIDPASIKAHSIASTQWFPHGQLSGRVPSCARQPVSARRVDPFDFMGRRKHVSCSLEDFEAMRVRPSCACPPKEDMFCLCDDRGAAAYNRFLLQNLLVSVSPLRPEP
jgi:hypothetical protein